VLLAGEPTASVINQATGMVGARLGTDVGTALTLLRARAIGSGRTLVAVAEDVLAGRLHLASDAG
jgi:AmiR/NasT family two-component response regulator